MTHNHRFLTFIGFFVHDSTVELDDSIFLAFDRVGHIFDANFTCSKPLGRPVKRNFVLADCCFRFLTLICL